MRTRYGSVDYFRILKEIAETLNKGVSLDQTVASTLPLVVELLNLHTGWLFLLDDQGDFDLATCHDLPPALTSSGEPWRGECTCQRLARTGDLHSAAQVVECSRLRESQGDRQGLAYHASVPLVKGERLLGIMNVATPEWDLFTPQDLQVLSAIGYQLATAIERTQLAEQATRIALVEERNRLAREVHDTLAQELAGIALQLEAADALLDRDTERARARLRQALARTRESLAEARRSVLDLRSGPLERRDLGSALLELARRFGDETGVAVVANIQPGLGTLPARVEQALYRIAQEALANVHHHAQATRVELGLCRDDGSIRMTIADNGRGFMVAAGNLDPAAAASAPRPADRAPHGFGLISMSERAHLLGGTMVLSSCPGEGTRIEVVAPIEMRPS